MEEGRERVKALLLTTEQLVEELETLFVKQFQSCIDSPTPDCEREFLRMAHLSQIDIGLNNVKEGLLSLTNT